MNKKYLAIGGISILFIGAFIFLAFFFNLFSLLGVNEGYLEVKHGSGIPIEAQPVSTTWQGFDVDLESSFFGAITLSSYRLDENGVRKRIYGRGVGDGEIQVGNSYLVGDKLVLNTLIKRLKSTGGADNTNYALAKIYFTKNGKLRINYKLGESRGASDLPLPFSVIEINKGLANIYKDKSPDAVIENTIEIDVEAGDKIEIFTGGILLSSANSAVAYSTVEMEFIESEIQEPVENTTEEDPIEENPVEEDPIEEEPEETEIIEIVDPETGEITYEEVAVKDKGETIYWIVGSLIFVFLVLIAIFLIKGSRRN